MVKLSTLVTQFNELWPESGIEDWDRPGLMLGDLNQDISKVLLSVDITAGVLAEARSQDAGLIISHHPMFLRGVHSLSGDSAKGANVAFAIQHSLAVFSAHTNADFLEGGVSDTLGASLGLTKTGFLLASPQQGFIGELAKPLTLMDFARLAAKVLPPVAQGVMVAGDEDKMIQRVGLVAGAGDSYLGAALAADFDLFITSDLRHHPSQDFLEQSALTGETALMNIAHFAAEWLWLSRAAAQLSEKFPDIEFVVSDLSTDPWNFVVMQ